MPEVRARTQGRGQGEDIWAWVLLGPPVRHWHLLLGSGKELNLLSAQEAEGVQRAQAVEPVYLNAVSAPH